MELNKSKDNPNCGESEEETIDDSDDLDERSQYEIENDAKRYKNKVFLHNTVLVRDIVKL